MRGNARERRAQSRAAMRERLRQENEARAAAGEPPAAAPDPAALLAWAKDEPEVGALLLAAQRESGEGAGEPPASPAVAEAMGRIVEAGLACAAALGEGRVRLELSERGRCVAAWLLQHEAEEELAQMFERMPVGADHRFLDLGCGAGPALLQASARGARVAVGLDLDRESLRAARALLAAAGARGWLVQAEAGNLPFKDGAFTQVACRLLLPYVGQRRAVGEVGRVLAPCGRVFFQLHSWRFYVRLLLKEFGRWKRVLLNGFCLANGLWFHLTGRQAALPLKGGAYRELCQTEAGMAREMARARLTVGWLDNGRLFRVLGVKLGG